jgi:hypothetical protein
MMQGEIQPALVTRPQPQPVKYLSCIVFRNLSLILSDFMFPAVFALSSACLLESDLSLSIAFVDSRVIDFFASCV